MMLESEAETPSVPPKSLFTPGPWTWFDAVPGGVDHQGDRVDSWPMTVVAQSDDDPIAYPDTDYRSEETAKANAQLMSACPELLIACVAMLTTWGSDDEDGIIDARNKARDAVKKAIGTESDRDA